jgi:hypothetical protein
MAPNPPKSAKSGEGGAEVDVEFVIQGAYVKVSAIDGASGLEASVVGPASAPRAALSAAALRKLDYVRKQKGGA